ncbi:MAG TPA: DUF4097 family beta strand repeat-containing protein [Glycomyces sp.]|nr:DUF4097 family beta strand repeat-containing protein [Glycomyces sp.]
MRTAPAAAAFALALTAALGGCATGTEDDTWDLGAFSGDLTVVIAGADLEIREAAPGEADDALTVTRRLTTGREVDAPALDGGTLDLTADCGGFHPFGDCTIGYEITVPAATPVTVDGDNGSVTAIALGAATTIRTGNGAITVEEAAGPLDLRTASGAITVADASSESVAAVAANGPVDLSFGAVPDRVDVATENGAVTVSVPPADYRVTTTTDSGEVDNGLTETDASPHHIAITTENGAIELRDGD